jgi:hypothetical protein
MTWSASESPSQPPAGAARWLLAWCGRIAGANIMQTGFTAMRLGIAAYLVPFYFVYWPAPVHWDQAPLLDIVLALGGGAVAIFCIGGLGEQFLLRRLLWYKLALLAAGIVLILLLLGSSTTLHGIDGAILREQLRLGVDVLNLGVQDLRVNQIGFLADVFLAQYPGVAHVIMISTTLDDKACDSVKTRFFAPEDVLGYLNGGSGSSPAAPMRGAGLTPRYASPAPLAPVAAGHRS